jgi:hypothetical protein
MGTLAAVRRRAREFGVLAEQPQRCVLCAGIAIPPAFGAGAAIGGRADSPLVLGASGGVELREPFS